MNLEPLRLCSNGGMMLDATGLALGCCDPCRIAIEQERERIRNIARLVKFTEHGEGRLVVSGYDYSADEYRENTYDCKAAFYYEYKTTDSEWEEPVCVLEYFDCANCERHVVFQGVDPEYSWRFFELPDVCKGCVALVKNPTLLTTIDATGPHEPNEENFTYHLLYTYVNNSDRPQVVFWEGGGNDIPINRNIDNWAQLIKNGAVPTQEGFNIQQVFLYPHESVSLYDINESHNTTANPWEVHCKVYMAAITCDPCEVAMYKAMYENTQNVARRYGAGFYTGNGAHTPCKAAFATLDQWDYYTLYGFTCDTCELVQLWRDETSSIPYTEDETACDGEGEVQ